MRKLPLYPEFPHAAVSTVAPLQQNTNCQLCDLAKTNPSGQRCMSAVGTAGDILVVSDHPIEFERNFGRVMTGSVGKLIRKLVGRAAGDRAVVYTDAIGCVPPSSFDDFDKSIDACRPYVADVFAETDPQVVLLFGPKASQSILGRRPGAFSVRNGYGWIKKANGVVIPAFILIDPLSAVRNELVARALEEDVRWALSSPKILGPQHDAVYELIQAAADAEAAWEALRAYDGFIATDTETSGMMFAPDFRIEMASVSNGKRTFVFDRCVFANDPEVLVILCKILSLLKHTSWNGQYDYCAFQADPLFFPIRDDAYSFDDGLCHKDDYSSVMNLWSDARVKRKLYEADAEANLAVSAELVGMGGHKLENRALVEQICEDLHKYALSFTLTETGKKRTWKGSNFFKASDVPEKWVYYLNEGIAEEKFAHRFVPREVEQRYNALDALSTWHLENWAHDRLVTYEDDGLLTIWNEVCQSTMWAYCRMRTNGMPVSSAGVGAFRLLLESEMEMSLKSIHRRRPGLNPLSNPQVVELMKDLGIKSKRKTGSGNLSASKEVLEEFRHKHDIIGEILSYRTLQKIHGTYAVGMTPWITPDDCVHPSILQSGTECMPAGEQVLTDRGYVGVEKVKVGDLVLTHRGRFRAVVNTVTNSPSVIYKITTKKGLQLRTTANHPYLVRNELGECWIPANLLVPGHKLVTLHNQPEQFLCSTSWPGYLVSSWGRVLNSGGVQIAAQHKGKWGHLKVTLSPRGQRKRGPDGRRDVAVHRLVAERHVEPVDGKKEVRHLNGFAWDNDAANLAWGTAKENRADARKHGTMSHRRSSKQVKLSVEAVEGIRLIPRSEASDAALAEVFGVSRELIRDVRNGKRWLPETYIEGKAVRFFDDEVSYVVISAPEVTYGLTVEEDHSHVTCGIVTHNTGRPSAAEPNLLNVVKGRDADTRRIASMFRNCFVAPPGHSIVEADEKQIEIRAAAEFSEDPLMVQTIVSGVDFHKASAEKFAAAMGKDYAAMTDEQKDLLRERAKTTNFAAVYEIPCELPFMLQSRLKITRREAEDLGKSIFQSYTRLREWMDEMYAYSHATGSARTYWKGKFGRRRPLWGLGFNPPTLAELEKALESSKGYGQAQSGKYDKSDARATYNTPVQGGAVDIVASMLWIVQRWLDANTNGGKLVLHVYDSIMVVVKDADVQKTVAFLRLLMSDSAEPKQGYTARVPLGVDIKYGRTWSTLKKVE